MKNWFCCRRWRMNCRDRIKMKMCFLSWLAWNNFSVFLSQHLFLFLSLLFLFSFVFSLSVTLSWSFSLHPSCLLLMFLLSSLNHISTTLLMHNEHFLLRSFCSTTKTVQINFSILLFLEFVLPFIWFFSSSSLFSFLLWAIRKVDSAAFRRSEREQSFCE